MTKSATALVFSTDEAFAPLAKGLVLSILSQVEPGEFDLKLVDIGCSAETLAWMRSHGVEVKVFDRTKFLRPSKNVLKPYQDAQFCRPFLPRLFPGYEVYVWCDSDIWIQDISSLRLYRDLAKKNPEKVPISPIVDVSYDHMYQDFSEFTRYSKIWFEECYGETIATTYFNRAIFSSGIFAMYRDCPIWLSWEKELENILKRTFSSQKTFHLGEQTALNYLLYSYGNSIPLSAEHNYNCHMGSLVRNKDDLVVVGYPPSRNVGVVHLSYSGKMMGSYIENNLLYKSGSYLTDPERKNLLQLSHY